MPIDQWVELECLEEPSVEMELRSYSFVRDSDAVMLTICGESEDQIAIVVRPADLVRAVLALVPDEQRAAFQSEISNLKS